MSIECGLFGGMDDYFGRRVAVGNVYCPGAVFVLESGVPPQQASASLFLCTPALVPSGTSISCAYYGE